MQRKLIDRVKKSIIPSLVDSLNEKITTAWLVTQEEPINNEFEREVKNETERRQQEKNSLEKLLLASRREKEQHIEKKQREKEAEKKRQEEEKKRKAEEKRKLNANKKKSWFGSDVSDDEVNASIKNSSPSSDFDYELYTLENKVSRIEKEVRNYNVNDINRSNIKNGIVRAYRNRFQRNEWPNHQRQLEALFDQQCEKFSPEKIISQLLERHAWLEEALDKKGGVIDLFLRDLLNQALNNLAEPNVSSLSNINIDFNQWKKMPFKWKSLDEAELKKRIEGYPVSNVEAHYTGGFGLQNWGSTLANLVETARSQDVSEHQVFRNNFVSAALTRVDFLRFLFETASPDMRAVLVDGIACVQRAPMHIDEIKYLSDGQQRTLHQMFVNMATEANPLWVMVNKKNNEWTATVPHDEKLFTVEMKNKLIAAFAAKLKIETAKDETNAKNNDLQVLDAKASWHALLLGRLYSASAEQRKHVPLSILLRWVWKRCLVANEYVESAESAFSTRFPITDKLFVDRLNKANTNSYSGSPYKNSKLVLSEGNMASFVNLTKVDPLMDGFDTNIRSLDKELTTLRYQSGDDEDDIRAMDVVYHNGIPVLEIKANEMDVFRMNNIPLAKELFNYDINVRTVRLIKDPAHKMTPYHRMALQSAARNRFLDAVKPSYLAGLTAKQSERKQLWQFVAKEWEEFSKNSAAKIDLDFINATIQFNKEWRKNHCDHRVDKSALTPEMWSFLQLAQMGTEGLDALFTMLKNGYANSWDPVYKEPAPNFSAVFDLGGSLADTPEEYLKYLSDKIASFPAFCTPLFKSLGFVFPGDMNYKPFLEDFEKLIDRLGTRLGSDLADCCEISLYNFNIENQPNVTLILNLLEKAKNSNLRILVRIPEWDRLAPENHSLRSCKAKYLELQNAVLNNQRRARQAGLAKQTKSIYDCADNKLNPEVIIQDRKGLRAQAWVGDDVTYPLIVRTPGLQQQQQEQVVAQFEAQAEQEQEKEQEQEQEQEVTQFMGNEHDLITRDNIDEKAKTWWAAIPPKVKSMSGCNDNILRNLFSQWVGSDINADEVIERIEPEAVKKMMQYAPQFRLGIAKDNLPPGFTLSRSNTQKGLILCFSENREKKDKYARKLKPGNPFTVELNDPMQAQYVRGDFRQFEPLASAGLNQTFQTLWKYLASEEQDQKKTNNAKKLLEKEKVNLKGDDDNVTATIQRFDARSEKETPEDRRVCLQDLARWARNLNVENGLVVELFDVNNEKALTRSNLKAFGQLFNQYSTLGERKNNGTEHWLFLANQIFKTFGRDYFRIWRARFLDVSQNWSETLEKDEVDAVALSIATLKNKPEYAAVWWRLVDAHGRSAGAMRYAKLWHAFQKVVALIEKQNLMLSKDSWLRYLDKAENFNANVFLDRLNKVLRKSLAQLEHKKIQQEVLDHIDQIDWRHNGYYYASRFESYPYWQNGLKLSQFSQAVKSDHGSYQANWLADDVLISPQLQALRFLASRANLAMTEFPLVEKRLKQFDGAVHQAELVRLFSASYSIGVDRFSDMTDDAIATVSQQLSNTQDKTKDWLAWLNSRLNFSGDILPGKYQIHWQDLAPFVTVMKKYSVESVVKFLAEGFKGVTPESFINASGRVLECAKLMRFPADIYFDDSFETLNKKKSNQSLRGFFSYPWLMKNDSWQQLDEGSAHPSAEVENEVAYLRSQLSTIDFAKTKREGLPTAKEINAAIVQIRAGNSRTAPIIRKEIISKWMERGCAFTILDAPFRVLNAEERAKAIKFFDQHLKGNYKDLNTQLVHKLLDQLAVKADLAGWPHVERLLKVLIKLDNKLHYNELGPVIGKLMSHTKIDNKNSYYSVPQLTAHLEMLVDDAKIRMQHYPVNLLNVLITNAIENPQTGLIANDLNKLSSSEIPYFISGSVRSIVRLELANEYKPVLMRLVLKAAMTNDKDDLKRHWH